MFIDISMNKETFNIIILNSFKNNIEKVKIMELGHSTKGKNRGYGLSLVKDIIKTDSEKYELEFDIEEKLFKSVLRMKTL